MQDEFPDVIKRITGEKGCLPRQVFNADENVLFWKNEVQQRISVSTEDKWAPGFKAGRESLMLLFCTNTAQFMISSATALIYKAAYVDPWRKRHSRSATSFLVEQQEVLDNKNPFFWIVSIHGPFHGPWTMPLVMQNIMNSTLKMSKWSAHPQTQCL